VKNNGKKTEKLQNRFEYREKLYFYKKLNSLFLAFNFVLILK